MGVLADLVPKAMGAGLADATDDFGATEGVPWSFPFEDVRDDTDEPVDLSATTGSCIIQAGVDGDTVIELDYTGEAGGRFTLTAAAADTDGLALDGTLTNPRDCRWSLIVDDGDDSVQFWSPLLSHFYIYPAGATI